MILPYSTLNVVSPNNWSSHKRTIHIPGNHALPPGFSNEAAWELGYAKADIDPVLGRRRQPQQGDPWSNASGSRGQNPATDLSSPYSTNEASVKLMSLLQRGNQLRRIRIPVGGWPSGVMFGMGMRPTDATESPPPGGAARNTSMAMAMNAAFVAIHAEAAAKAKPAEDASGEEKVPEEQRREESGGENEGEDDEEGKPKDGDGDKMPKLDSKTAPSLTSLETIHLGNAPSVIASSKAPTRLMPISNGPPKPGILDTFVSQKQVPRPPTSMGKLEPLSLPPNPDMLQQIRPATPSHPSTQHSTPSLPPSLNNSSSITANPSTAQVPYKICNPHPPPGPPPAVPEITVSNPAFLPEPLARNRRFHSRSINPAYLLQLATCPDPNTPESLYVADYCSSPVGGGVSIRNIPSKYLAAFNAVAAVNGLPQAQGIETQPIADPRMHVPVTT
ncbi:hypothetical protein HDU67_003694, partial [Dinochytrium kinnereticum]